MGEKRKRVEIENGHDGVYPLHREELTPGCSTNNRTAVRIQAYRPQAPKAEGYSIDDHPYLAEGSSMYGAGVRDLFDEIRKQILALDPCVTEEFLKLYVAYKAETNFVDIVPQAKRLVLRLNMDFHAISDPRALCRDVRGLGKWGNGDIAVGLSSKEDIPYMMGLIRQAFEKQMGNGGAE